jgi:tetratricopeptide (TPR) repeat protein
MPSRAPEAAALPVLLAGGLLLAGLVCAVYAPVLANGFVWDDWTVVLGTRAHRPLTAAGLGWMLRASVAGHYHPLTWLSFTVGEALFGTGPAAAHALNVGLHLLNAGLAVLLGERLLRHARPGWSARARASAALLAAAFFALHPLRVESVAWATERRDVLSAAFVLGALVAWVVRATARRPGAWYAASLALFGLALLSKAQATVPAVLLVLDLYPLRRLRGATPAERGRSLARLAVEKGPFLVLAAAASAAALRAQSASGALLDLEAHPLPARAAQAAYGLVFYLRATFAAAFSPLHERPVPLDWHEPRFLLSGLAVLLLGAAVWWSRRTRPALAAAAAAYVLFLLPVLGLFQSGVQLVAERYSYLACLGFGLVAAAGAADLWQGAPSRARRAGLAAGLGAVLFAWTVLGHRHARVFHDDETLWRTVAARGPSALATNNLGQMMAGRGAFAEATALLSRSLEIVPTYPRPWTALQALLEGPPGAVPPETARALLPVLEASARAQPTSAGARYTLGLARARAGDARGALTDFESALQIDPRHRGARASREKAKVGEVPLLH